VTDTDLGHPRRWRILAVLVGSLMAVIIDTTILNVSLRTLSDSRRGLGASHDELEWVLNSYTIVFAALLFSWGIVADRIGRKRILLTGLALFGAASLGSAYSQNPGQLIAARGLMGLGAAAVMPCTLAIVAAVFPPQERPRAIGVWSAAIGVAIALGPVTGGLLLEHFWWGSVFLVNVPVVAVVAGAVALVVPESRAPYRRPLDLAGVGLSITGLVLLVYGIIEGGRRGSLAAPMVWGSLLAGLLVMGFFVRHERRTANPAFEVKLFRNPGFSAAIAAVGFVSFAMSGFLFVSAFYLQSVRGLSPLQAGACTLALALALVVFGPLSVATVRRFGPKQVCSWALLTVAVALALLTSVDEGTPIWAILPDFFLLGAGIAYVMPPAAVSIMMSLPRENAGIGSAMNNTMRQVGQVLGVAILGSVLSAAYRHDISDSVARLPTKAAAGVSESIEATLVAAGHAGEQGTELAAAARNSFVAAMHVSSVCAAVVALVGAAVVARWLPGRPKYVPQHRFAPARRNLGWGHPVRSARHSLGRL
jgi:EmrB/QacA subfamily drug resistance transporter